MTSAAGQRQGDAVQAAAECFFEAEPLTFQEPPEGVAGYRDTALGEFSQQGVEGEVRFLGDARQQPIAFTIEQASPTAAHALGRRLPRLALPQRPLDHSRWRDVVKLRHLAAAETRLQLRQHTTTKIKREWTRRLCWSPIQHTA